MTNIKTSRKCNNIWKNPKSSYTIHLSLTHTGVAWRLKGLRQNSFSRVLRLMTSTAPSATSPCATQCAAMSNTSSVEPVSTPGWRPRPPVLWTARSCRRRALSQRAWPATWSTSWNWSVPTVSRTQSRHRSVWRYQRALTPTRVSARGPGLWLKSLHICRDASMCQWPVHDEDAHWPSSQKRRTLMS